LSLGFHSATFYFAGRREFTLQQAVAQMPVIVVGAGLITLAAGFVGLAIFGDKVPAGALTVIALSAGVMLMITGAFTGGYLVFQGRFGMMNLVTISRVGMFALLVAVWV